MKALWTLVLVVVALTVWEAVRAPEVEREVVEIHAPAGIDALVHLPFWDHIPESAQVVSARFVNAHDYPSSWYTATDRAREMYASCRDSHVLDVQWDTVFEFIEAPTTAEEE